ncbi:MAG TPA: hypothetical protein VJM15_01705 [Sphingomicrobium sp.]|nr:hypothetical protein [Sphingomicrobium sp.]
MKSDVLHDAVALVEDAEHGNPLRHRRDPRLIWARRNRGVADDRLRVILICAPVACADGKGQQGGRCG